MPHTLSVAIITLNEEANLARTLASVQFADEIIVLDSSSTDRTHDIAAQFNATLYIEPSSEFSSHKNHAIEKCTCDWILSLDADEELSPELQTEIRTLLSNNPTADAYLIPRRNLLLNRWMRHGGYYPDAKLRLFRRSTANFTPPSRFTDRPVHETIAFTGTLATLHHDLIHHAFPTVTDYIEHMDRYSTIGAQLLIAKGETSRSLPSFLKNIIIDPTASFLANYIFRLGFLDGREGFLLHLYHSAYMSWMHSKAWYAARQA